MALRTAGGEHYELRELCWKRGRNRRSCLFSHKYKKIKYKKEKFPLDVVHSPAFSGKFTKFTKFTNVHRARLFLSLLRHVQAVTLPQLLQLGWIDRKYIPIVLAHRLEP